LYAGIRVYASDGKWLGDFDSIFKRGKWVPNRCEGYRLYLMDLYGHEKGGAMFEATPEREGDVF
jgi:hypothetical protein